MRFIHVHWFLLITIIVGVVLQLYSTQCAPGITYDSNQYLASAKSFAHNQTLLHADGTPHVDHVPLYSLILSFLGENRLQWSKYLNTLCLGAILLMFAYLCRQTLAKTVNYRLCILSLALATPLQLIHHFVWSEPLFVVLLAGILVFLYKYQQQPHPAHYWAITGLSFILCLQRNPGIFLVAGVALSLWVFTQAGFGRVLLYGCLGVSGWVGWTIVGMQLTQSGLHPAAYNIFGNILVKQNLDHYLNAISAWFVPLAIPLLIRGSAFIVGVLLIAWWMRKYNLRLDKFTKILLTIAATYIVFLQLTERISFHETERYAAVVFPLLWLVFFQVYDTLSEYIALNHQWLLTALMVVWLSYPTLRTAKNIHLWQTRTCERGYVKRQTSDPHMIYYKDEDKK